MTTEAGTPTSVEGKDFKMEHFGTTFVEKHEQNLNNVQKFLTVFGTELKEFKEKLNTDIRKKWFKGPTAELRTFEHSYDKSDEMCKTLKTFSEETLEILSDFIHIRDEFEKFYL